MATCLHPTIVRDKIFPCGKCPVCRQNYRQNLANRMLLESAFCKGATYFVTLTYDNEHLHYFKNELCFCKKDVQNLIRYLRKDAHLKIKYFITSEYGEHTKRPHYHGLFFFQSPKCESPNIFEFERILQKLWKFGFISISLVSDNRISYACKYALKDEFQFYHKYDKDDPRKPFRLFSLKPGIGSSAIDFINDYIYNCGEHRNYFIFNGKRFNFDTFIKRHIDPSLLIEIQQNTYYNNIDEINERLLNSKISHSKEVFDELSNSYKLVSDFTKDDEILKHRFKLKQLKNKSL